jgi:hypothetical protein
MSRAMTKREDLRKEYQAVAELRLMKVEEIIRQGVHAD